MKLFLDRIDNYVLILDEEFNILHCNKKLLKKMHIDLDKIEDINIIINEEEKVRDMKLDEDINLEILLISPKIDIKVNGQVSKGNYNNKPSIFMLGESAVIVKYKEALENKKFEDNLKKEREIVKCTIKTLDDMIDQINKNPYICELLKNDNIVFEIENIKNEIYKSELIIKDFEVFLGISIDLLGVMDKDTNLKIVNNQWINILGWSEEELLGTNLINFICKKHIDIFEEIVKSESEDVTIVENKVLCKDGNYKWLRWNIKYVKEKDLFGFTIRDISKEKEQDILIKKLEESVHLESIKNEFFANMSHEFKTPLNIILGTMQLLDINAKNNNITSNGSIDLEKYISLIKQNSYRLLKLINNLMDITKIENGYYEVMLNNHNIISIIEDITLSVVHYAESKNISVVFDTNCEEQIIACDPEKIERILLNLLSNSIKHTNENGMIEVKIEVKEDKTHVSVIDNGDGIAKEKIPIIFNRYVQGSNTLTKPCEGSGIGLSLVKSLIQMHGGNIEVSSKEGIGSEFKLSLPNKTTNLSEGNISDCKIRNNKIEMCNIEFSDIYGI